METDVPATKSRRTSHQENSMRSLLEGVESQEELNRTSKDIVASLHGTRWAMTSTENIGVPVGTLTLSSTGLHASWDEGTTGHWQLWHFQMQWYLILLVGQDEFAMELSQDRRTFEGARSSDAKHFCGTLIEDDEDSDVNAPEAMKIAGFLNGTSWSWKDANGAQTGTIALTTQHLSASWCSGGSWSLWRYHDAWYVLATLQDREYALQLSSDLTSFQGESGTAINPRHCSGNLISKNIVFKGMAGPVGLNSADAVLTILTNSVWGWCDDQKHQIGTIQFSPNGLITSFKGNGHWSLWEWEGQWFILAKVDDQEAAWKLSRDVISFTSEAWHGWQNPSGFLISRDPSFQPALPAKPV